jgi:RNA polymerase-binding transcription factor DksA
MNTERFKEKLEAEVKHLETELGTLGRRNPDTPGDWEATPGQFDTNPAEAEERAEKFTELENNESILNPLELRLRDVKRAIAKMESGKFGVCEIGEEPIEEERLDANPAARTCIAHLQEEKDLPL